MYTLFGMGLFPNAHCHRCFPQNSFIVSHSFCISKAKTNTQTRGGDTNVLSNYSTNEDQLIMTPKYSTAPTALKKIESLVENFSLFFCSISVINSNSFCDRFHFTKNSSSTFRYLAADAETGLDSGATDRSETPDQITFQ